MVTNNFSNIKRFISHFTKEIGQIKEISGPSIETFRKTLYVSLIDAVSRSVYVRKKGNRDRFVSLIRNFSNWETKERVSLPHLIRLLELNPDPVFEPVREKAFELFSTWQASWGNIPLTHDPEFKEIDKLWPKDKEYRMPIEGISLESLTHTHLLYAYRNTLVHELRTSGYGMELEEDKKPFYHDLDSYDSSEGPPSVTIELVYPTQFFHNLSLSIISNLEEYLIRNDINPYDSYKFGTYWIQELNE